MTYGLRLVTSEFVHILSNQDSDGFVEWITDLGAHPELAAFLRSVPTGTRVRLVQAAEGDLALFPDALGVPPFHVALRHFLASQSDFETFLQFLNAGEEITLVKDLWTGNRYNEWLRWESDENDVFPETCRQCGSLMGCSKEHYSRRKRNWDRLRCSNSFCGCVEASVGFVEKIASRNFGKLAQEIQTALASHHSADVLIEPARGDAHSLTGNQCRECGGTTLHYRTIRSPAQTSHVFACIRCFGSATTSHTLHPLP